MALPEVGTLTVNETGFGDVIVSMLEDRTQVAPTGAPAQVMEMLPVKPAPGLICKLYCAV